MTLSERTVGNVTFLDLGGQLVMGEGAERLCDKVRSLLQQDRKLLILNLAAVPYIDSAGLGQLVESFATARNQGGALKLVNMTRRLHDLLVITKLSNVFDSYDTEAAALASFAPPAAAPAPA